MSQSSDLAAKRRDLRTWLGDENADGAVFAYYLLHHPANRTRLHMVRNENGKLTGALAECITGYDLFRPLVVMLGEDDEALRRLIQEAMPRNRPCLLLSTLHYAPVWQEFMQLTEDTIYRLYALDLRVFEPVINVLVTWAKTPDGLPRYEIRSPDKAVAAASLNWRSPRFAEIAVHTEPAARGRRWGESVVSALCAELIGEGVMPLYLANEMNEASRRLAERVGFRETGRRILFTSAIWSAGE